MFQKFIYRTLKLEMFAEKFFTEFMFVSPLCRYKESLFTVRFTKFRTMFLKNNRQHLDSRPSCFFENKSKTTKYLVFKFCDRC